MRLVGLLACACHLIALHGTLQGDERHSIGEVVLADWPYCNVLVLRSGGGFSVAEWKDGLWLYQAGDVVTGRLDDVGEFPVWIDNAVRGGEMLVVIERAHATWVEAKTTFYDRCAIRGWRHTAGLLNRAPGFQPVAAP